MSRIHARATNAIPNTKGAIARVRTYHDTIGVSARRRFPAELLRAIKANCGTMIPRLRRDGHDPATTWRYVLIVHQPSRWAFKLLHRYKREKDGSLNVFKDHVAFDFEPCEGYSREDVLKIVYGHRRLKHQRADARAFDYFETTYSRAIDDPEDEAQTGKRDVIYCHKPSKLDGTPNAIHTELRGEAGREVKTMGLNDPLDGILLNPSQFFPAQYSVKQHDDILGKIIARTIRKTAEHYCDLSPSIVERRVRGLFHRWGCDRLVNFRWMFPHQYRRLKPWDVLEFNELEYATEDRKCAYMSSLSSVNEKHRAQRERRRHE